MSQPDDAEVLITEDNIAHSRVRHEAIKAYRANKATPEQMKLLQDLDDAIKRGREVPNG
jgi:hypothetical protein